MNNSQNYRFCPQHIPLKWFNKNNGLDSGQVHNICQDESGMIWFSGPNGLSRYNGNVLENFTKKLKLHTHGLRKVIAAPDGTLFVATDSGIEQVRDNRSHLLVDEWNYGQIHDMVVHPTRGLLFSSSTGLYNYHDQSIREIHQGMFNHLVVDMDDNIWANSKAMGLCVLDHQFNHRSHDLAHFTRKIKHISCNENNVISICTHHDLIEAKNLKLVRSTPFTDLQSSLNLGYELWLGINSQLIKYTLIDDQWQHPTVLNQDSFINDFYQDSFDNIWCSTDQHGAIKVSALRKMVYQPRFEKNGTVFSINELEPDHLLLAGRNVNEMVNLTNINYYVDLGAIKNSIIWDQIHLKDHKFLLATDSGMYFKHNEHPVKLFENNDLLSQHARVILRRGDEIWIGTRYGLSKILMDQNDQPFISQQFKLGYVYCLDLDSNNKLWVGTIGSGLFIESNNDFIKHKLRYVNKHANIYCIRFNQANDCAILHDNLITVHHDTDEPVLITQTDTLISGWSVVWDQHYIWVGGVNGLSQFDTKKKQETRNITALLSQANWEFTTSKSLQLVADRYLFCGLNSGLAVVDMQQLELINKPLSTHLDEVIWENAEISKEHPMTCVKPGNWTLRIKFYSAFFHNELNLKYRYQLIGFSDDWQVTKLNFVQFNSLPIGRYQLMIQAFSPLRGWSEVTRLYQFKVITPAWAKGWLNAIYKIYSVFYGVFSNKRKNSALVQMNKHLETQLKLKNEEVNSAFNELRSANEALQDEANNDPLTGLANRRAFQKVLLTALDDSTRSNSPLALLMLDIDNFKSFNDRYGHDIGDLVLVNVSQVIESSVRKGDHASRFGGEEFAVILPHTTLAGAKTIANKIVTNVRNIDTQSINPHINDSLTISIGIGFDAEADWEKTNPEKLIKMADEALYLAKGKGKDQFAFVPED